MPELTGAGLVFTSGVALTIALFVLTYRRMQSAEPTCRPVDLNMTHRELRDLATKHQVYDSRWRCYATKARLVRGLHKYGVTHV